MRVLGLCSYPNEAAATRFRLAQFVEPLAERGIELYIAPFLTSKQFADLYTNGSAVKKAADMIPSVLRRIRDAFTTRKFDVLFVQREAMIFGPGFFEWLYQKVGRIPIVLDLDDATYVRYVSPSYGKLGSALKFFGKTDALIKRADTVICGNRFIAEHVEKLGTKSVVIPTVVDTDKFCPVERSNPVPVIGWIGTHSTYPFLESLFPVLQRLAKKHLFVMKIVGAGRKEIRLNGIDVINLEWNLEREIEDFQTLDIGLYPITVSASANADWLAGKSGFKAIQYMAVGVPFVMSPVGVCTEIGEPGRTHFNAETHDEWHDALNLMLELPELRANMGCDGRCFSLKNFTVEQQVAKLEAVLKEFDG